MLRTLPTTVPVALWALALVACSDPVNAPRPRISASETRTLEASTTGPGNATVRWNAIARAQTLTHTLAQQAGVRMFAYLSLAEYNAAVAARHAEQDGDHASATRGDERPSVPAAIAGASAVVLASFFPDQASYFDTQVAQANAADADDGADFAAGEALGRAVGAAVLASAATDGFTASVAGVVIPVCPGCWVSAPAVAPVFPLLGRMRPFFLGTGSQFRPGLPPAFGSPAYLDALAEVRHFSDTRTHEQDSIAKFWAKPAGYSVIQSYANQIATDEIAKFHLGDLRAAHVLALMGMAAMDAFIASHDAKYVYWLIRPSQADPGIVLAIPLPNHPSYPSNHACVTGASMAALASFFPRDADYLNGLADQAGISRIYAGIHYPFDMDVGLALGRTITRYAIAHDVHGHEAYALK
jgi:hypothetical protein